MGTEVYIDLEILADMDSEYLVRVSKSALNSLVAFDESLTIRHWDGNKPVVLEPYGKTAIRTREDASSTNNLVEMPNTDVDELLMWLLSEE
jgi:hypothetical protein